jgi:hypothetical protein
MSQIIYEYFKKTLPEAIILVRINPENYEGLELIITKNNLIRKTKRIFDNTIYEDLKYDEFVKGNPIAFNLYLNGLDGHK